MPLSLRRRGAVWHARGTVRVGRESVQIAEFSTGCRARIDAEAVAAAEEARIRTDRIDGPIGRQSRLTIDDCLARYLQRPGGVRLYDAIRVRGFSDFMGDRVIRQAPEAWSEWLASRGPRFKPGSALRWRTILRAALAEGCKALGAGAPPELPPVQHRHVERLVYLTDAKREALLAAYSPAAGAVAVMLAYQGMRTQEALRLDWRAVSLAHGTLRIERSKSGRGRSVPLHPRTAAMLDRLWQAAGQPDAGPVFLSSRGKPYQDTTDKGGNPIKKAHRNACKAAGVAGFRVHDWRHDWAARCVMGGMDLVTLMRLGGWSTLSMVQRYASVSADHMRDALARIR